MSDFLGALRSYLLADPGVRACIAGAEAGYVADVPPQPSNPPQSLKPSVQQAPYFVLHGISDPGHYHLGGVADVYNPLVQVEWWAPTSIEASDLADAGDVALRAYRGPAGGMTDVLGCFRRDRRGPTAIDSQDGGERPLFMVQSDYEAWRR